MPTITDRVTRPRGEDTRRRLIEAAHAQFLAQGYHGTSMRHIAQAAGLAVGGIYNHFANKEDVFVEVLDEYHPYHVIVPALEAAQGERLEDFLLQLMRLIRTAIQDQRDQLLPLIFIEMVEFRGRHIPALAARILPAFEPFLARFSEHQAELRPLALPVVQRAFVGMLVGHLVTDFILQKSPIGADPSIDWLAGALDVFLHGILKDPA
ncbi:MAG: TetR/AcrR family transcriptional regulator [Anaerolineales bacterium]|nr:TetR/AcrR family transcriptional regulator [Anaerolineales bacterium]